MVGATGAPWSGQRASQALVVGCTCAGAVAGGPSHGRRRRTVTTAEQRAHRQHGRKHYPRRTIPVSHISSPRNSLRHGTIVARRGALSMSNFRPARPPRFRQPEAERRAGRGSNQRPEHKRIASQSREHQPRSQWRGCARQHGK